MLHSFGSSRGDGAEPVGALVAVNGDLYGTTFAGGASTKCKGSGCGIVFSISTTGKENLLYTFRGGGGDGAGPFGGLLFLNGEFYGTTSEGGPSGVGTVFDLSLSGTERVLHSFGGSDGEAPRAGLVALNGALYGTTLDGGAYSVGTVFKIYP